MLTQSKLNSMLVNNFNKVQMPSNIHLEMPLRSSIKDFEHDIFEQLTVLSSLLKEPNNQNDERALSNKQRNIINEIIVQKFDQLPYTFLVTPNMTQVLKDGAKFKFVYEKLMSLDINE